MAIAPRIDAPTMRFVLDVLREELTKVETATEELEAMHEDKNRAAMLLVIGRRSALEAVYDRLDVIERTI